MQHHIGSNIDSTQSLFLITFDGICETCRKFYIFGTNINLTDYYFTSYGCLNNLNEKETDLIISPLSHDNNLWVLRVTNLNGLPHSLLSYGHLIPGERACTGLTCLIKKFFQGPSKGRYIPWAVPEDSGYWLNGVLRGWSANG